MSSDENDKSTEQVLEYYTKYSQNRNLSKYFSGTSVSYLPPIAVEQNDNEPSGKKIVDQSKQPVHISEINIVLDDGNSTSSSEGPSEHKKLEWDNGADIGYDSARKNSEKKVQKSSSLPTLNKLKELKPSCIVPASKPSTIITHSTSSKQVEVLVYGDSNSSNQSSSKSSGSKQVSVSSHSTENAKEQSLSSNTINTPKSQVTSSTDSNETQLVDFQSTIEYLKLKIGLPGAHSTPNIADNQLISNSRSSKSTLAALLSKNLSSKSKSDDMISIAASGSFLAEINTAQLKSSSLSSHSSSKVLMKDSKKKIDTKIVELSVTTPVNVNCKGPNVTSSDKTVQTVQPKAVQTDDADGCYMKMPLTNEQQQKSTSRFDHANIYEKGADLASSFEYISVDKNAKLLKLRKNHQDLISINSTAGVSGVIKEISILKNSTESSSLSRTSSDDIDRHLEILQKLLKTKKLNSRTKRKYLKILLKELNELETSNDSNNTTTSSELFIPRKGAMKSEKVKSKSRVAFKETDDIMDTSKIGNIRCHISSLPGMTYSSDEKNVYGCNHSSSLSSSPGFGNDTPKDHKQFANANDKVEILEPGLVDSKNDLYQCKNLHLSKSSRDLESSGEAEDVENKLTVDVGSYYKTQETKACNTDVYEVSKKTNQNHDDSYSEHLGRTASGSVHVHVTDNHRPEVEVRSKDSEQNHNVKISNLKQLPNTKSSSIELHGEYSSGIAIKNDNTKKIDQMKIAQPIQFPSAATSSAEVYSEYDTAMPTLDESVALLDESSKTFYQKIGNRVKMMQSKLLLPSATSSSTGSQRTKYDWDAVLGEIPKDDPNTNICVLQDQNVQTWPQHIEFNSKSAQSSILPVQNVIKGESTQTSKPLLQDHGEQISDKHVSKATSTIEILKSSSRSSSKYNTVRTDVTASTGNSGSKDSDDYLLSFAENERAYQLNWINNEICHLSKLKSILELKSRSRSRTGGSSRPKTSVYNVIQKNASSKTSERNYVIQTKLGVLTQQNINNYVLDGKEYAVSGSQKSTSDEDKATVASIQIKSNEKETNIQVGNLCSICKKVVCVCGSEKTITSKFPSLTTEPKDVDACLRFAQGIFEKGDDVNEDSACTNLPMEHTDDIAEKDNGEGKTQDETSPELSNSDTLSSDDYTSLQRVFKKCTCTVKDQNCGCEFVKNLLNKFRMQKVDNTTEILQTDSSPKLRPVQLIKPSAEVHEVQTDTLSKLSSAVQGKVDVAVADGACQTRNLCQQTMVQICIPPADNRKPQERSVGKHISLQTLKDIFSHYTQTEINSVSNKTQTNENHKVSDGRSKSKTYEVIPIFPSTEIQDFHVFRNRRGILDQKVTANSQEKRETQTEGNNLDVKRVQTKNIGIQAVHTPEKIENDQKITQTDGSMLHEKRVETNNIGIQAVSSFDHIGTQSSENVQDKATEYSREKTENDQKVTQTDENMLREKRVYTSNIGIQAVSSFVDIRTGSSEKFLDDGFKVTENLRGEIGGDQKETQTEGDMQEKPVNTKNIEIQVVSSSDQNFRTRSSQKVQDKNDRSKVTDNSKGESESDQKVTETEGSMLHAKRVVTKTIGIQAVSSFDNFRTPSSQKSQDIEDRFRGTENLREKSERNHKITEGPFETKSNEIKAISSFDNIRTRSTQKVQDKVDTFKVTENSREKSENDRKVTQMDGDMLHERPSENKNIEVQAIPTFENIRTRSSRKFQDKNDGLKESTPRNVEPEDISRTDRTVASSSHSSNVGTSAHISPSDSKSSASSRVTCFCCKQKAFLAEVSYLDEGNDSLALCSRCFYQRPRYCSHNPRFMCSCWSYWRSAQNFDTGQYCKCCRREASKCAKKLTGLMYTVTLPKHGSINKKRRSSRSSVENIKVQKGWSGKSLKNKENYYKKDDDRKNGLKKESRKKEVGEDKDDDMEKDMYKKRQQKENEHDNNKNDEDQYTLMEYLIRNRPKFIHSAEYRRQMLLNSRILRERQKDNLKLNFLENSLRNLNGDKYKLFTEREMKQINKKNYEKLPEVQGKLLNQRERRLRQADRLISNTLAKRVQKSVLQGRDNFPIDKPLTNL